MEIPQYKYTRSSLLIYICLGLLLVVYPYLLPRFISQNFISALDYEGFSILYILTMLGGLYCIFLAIYRYYGNDHIVFQKDSLRIQNKDLVIPMKEIASVKITPVATTFHTSQGLFKVFNSMAGNQLNVRWMIENDWMHEGDFKVTHKKVTLHSLIPMSLPLLALLSSLNMQAFLYFQNNLKYKLPLFKIETTEIEGTLTEDIQLLLKTVTNKETGVEKHEPGFWFKGGLAEFPNTSFRYNSPFALKDKIYNIKNADPETVAKLNLRNIEGSKITAVDYLLAGTKVKIKVRTDTYNQRLKQLNNSLPKRVSEYPVDFYELSVNDEIIVQKFGLK